MISLYSSQFTDDVFVDVDETGSSFTSIYTKDLTGCYGFLVNGDYRGSPFCFLNHHSYSINQKTLLTLPEILFSSIKDLVSDIKSTLKKILKLEQAIIRKDFLSNLSLFVGGGIQQTPDFVRLGFSLLQNQLDLAVINSFPPNSEELYVCQQLNYRTTIIDAVGYLMSEEHEELIAKKSKQSNIKIVIQKDAMY
jgi:hypothetical protein